MKNKDILTIPNFFSFIRIFLVIPIFYYISLNENITALIYVAIALITDGLDGFLARRLNQISELGKVLDPLADKICITGGFVALSVFQGFPVWITIIIISRDLIIAIGSIWLIGRNKVVFPSNYIGKVTVFLITVYAVIFLLGLNVLYTPLLIAVIVMLIISLFYYAKIFFTNLKNEPDV
jgi:cardiolipin synthase